MGIRGAIFDLDGVIVDTAKYHFKAWKRLAEELGVAFDEEDNESLKGVSRMKSLEFILSKGNLSYDQDRKKALAARKNTWFVDYLNEMKPDEILPGFLEFLKSVRSEGIKVSIGSASKNAVRALTNIGLIDDFNTIVDGTMITRAKPNPEVFLKAAKMMKLEPTECLVFEDGKAGVEAAKGGGMKCIGIGKPENLDRADLVIPNFKGHTWDSIVQQIQKTKGPQ